MLTHAHYQDITHFLSNFSNWTHPLDGRVYVIPDSEYKELKQEQALEDIKLMELRALSYEKTALLIRENVKKLKKEVGLLPEETASETAPLSASQD